MGTTVAIRFPLGRYHATPWDRSVNEGVAEWPPSPWRILRALVATWYTRWPDLPAPVVDTLLDALGDPPSYGTPPFWPGHTRHYLPDLDHKKGETGGTDLTLDPFLSVGRNDELLVRWGVDLSGEQREVFAKLVELVPYLGRADSACEARLVDDDPAPDETWWMPCAEGVRQTRLLVPTRPVSRPVLEQSTVEIRRNRRTVPPGTHWVSYGCGPQAGTRFPTPRWAYTVEAIRFFVTGPAPLKSTRGILLADAVHSRVGGEFMAVGLPDERRRVILGSGRAASDHQHAHWIPVAEKTERGAAVSALVLWVPSGLTPEEVASIVTLRSVSGYRGPHGNAKGYKVPGLPDINLLFQAVGRIEQVAPELCRGARRWQSLTPYLPVRHRKREPLDEYVHTDVTTELAYRNQPPAVVTRTDPDDALPDRWAREFRRYRLNERLGQSRPGLGLRLEFAEEVRGPLLLGQLSHFGYGIFRPE